MWRCAEDGFPAARHAQKPGPARDGVRRVSAARAGGPPAPPACCGAVKRARRPRGAQRAGRGQHRARGPAWSGQGAAPHGAAARSPLACGVGARAPRACPPSSQRPRPFQLRQRGSAPRSRPAGRRRGAQPRARGGGPKKPGRPQSSRSSPTPLNAGRAESSWPGRWLGTQRTTTARRAYRLHTSPSGPRRRLNCPRRGRRRHGPPASNR